MTQLLDTEHEVSHCAHAVYVRFREAPRVARTISLLLARDITLSTPPVQLAVCDPEDLAHLATVHADIMPTGGLEEVE